VKFHNPGIRRPQLMLTSLIDVMFIVLIFFIVSSTFAEQPGVPLELPRVSSAETGRITPATVTIDEKGNMWIQSAPIERGELKARLAELKARHGDIPVVLKAHRLVAYETALQVLRAAQELGFTKVVAPVTVEDETQNR